MRTALRWTGIVFGVLILLLAGAILFTQTDMFKGWLKDKLLAQTDKFITADLTVGKLEGNLYGTVRLNDITLVKDNEPIATIARVELGWRLLSLLKGELAIDSVVIDSLHFSARQYADSSWNFNNLMAPQPLDTAAKEADKPGGFSIDIADVFLRNSEITLEALDTALPGSYTDLNAQLVVGYSDSVQALDLKQLTFSIPELPFQLKHLAFEARRDSATVSVNNLELVTSRNELGGSVVYTSSDTAMSSAELQTRPVDFSEFRVMYPGLTLKVQPTLRFEGRIHNDSLLARLRLDEGEQAITLNLAMAGARRLMSNGLSDQTAYRLDGEFKKVDLAHWLGDTTLNHQLNGTVRVAGQGYQPDRLNVQVQGDFRQCILQGRPCDTILLDATINGGSLVASLAAYGGFGSLQVKGQVQDLRGAQVFAAHVSASKLNLQPIVGNDSLRSDLNLQARIEGRGFDPNTMAAQLEMVMAKSSINNTTLDTMIVRGDYSRAGIAIDTLYVKSPLGEIASAGTIGADSSGTLQIDVEIADLTALSHSFLTDTVAGHGRFNGTVSGRMDSLTVSGDFQFDSLMYGVYSVIQAVGTVDGGLIDSVPFGALEAQVRQISSPDYRIDSVYIKTSSENKVLTVQTNLFYQPDYSVYVDAGLSTGASMVIDLREMTVRLPEQTWQGGSDSTRIVLGENDYLIQNLFLRAPGDTASDTTGGGQMIFADGRVSMEGAEDLRLTISQLELEPLAELSNTALPMAGVLSADVTVTGTAQTPLVNADLRVDGMRFDELTIAAVELTGDYDNGQFRWEGAMVRDDSSRIVTSGFVPINLAMNYEGERFNGNLPLSVKFAADSFPLAIIRTYNPDMDVTDGWIEADVSIENTFNNPNLGGTFLIRKGALEMPPLGLKYSDIELSARLNSSEVQLDSLVLHRDDGYISASGFLRFDSSFLTGRIASTDFKLVAKDMYLARHENFEVQISGDAAMSGGSSDPSYSGDITINRSQIYLPALMDEKLRAKSFSSDEPPMLVAATSPESLLIATDTIQPGGEGDTSVLSTSEYFANLGGTINVAIPRNTWLRSPDMNVEISGELDMVKRGMPFEIFGTVQVRRGTYTLYGREFVIDNGVLNFSGGPEYNPDINISATYVFRDPDRLKRELKADVTGRAMQPVITFTLDGQALEERDAVAYVMFGRSMDQLTTGGVGGSGGNIGDQSEQVARGAAAGVVAGELSELLGNSLNLDVIDIEAASSWQAATVTVGKYLTNDLFMSYERSIGNVQNNEVTPATVTLEYELTRLISLQLQQGDPLSTGADVIFRIESE